MSLPTRTNRRIEMNYEVDKNGILTDADVAKIEKLVDKKELRYTWGYINDLVQQVLEAQHEADIERFYDYF